MAEITDTEAVPAKAKKTTGGLRNVFLGKKATTKPVQLMINGEQVEMTVQALPEATIRELRAARPPVSPADKKAGLVYDSKTFPPDILAHSVIDPVLSYEEWLEIWTSADWSLGELREMFDEVFSVSTDGFDLPFGATA